MKKGCVLFLAILLTACGVTGDDGDSGEQAAYIDSEHTESQYLEAQNEVGTAEEEESTAAIERTYEKESVLYSEPMGLSFQKDLEKTRTDYAAYYFEAAISEEERNACIETTDRMLACIDAVLPVFEVVVLEPKESYGAAAVTANRLFLPVQQWDSVDYLARVLLSGYGEWGNYGLAYGYADYIYRKAGLDGEDRSTGEKEEGNGDSFLPMSAPELYDLNLLCFEERFSSAEDVEAAKNNACLFVKEYLSVHSEEEFLELLASSGTLEDAVGAGEALEGFYAEKGVECSLSSIRYQYGGLTLDYAAACEYACFHVARDWQDQSWKQFQIVPENYLHEDYDEVRAFFECSERQMGEYQELFGFDSYDNSLLVRVAEYYNTRVGGLYLGDEHTIWLFSLNSLMHEYVHSIMFGRFQDWGSKWKTEGFARYFDYKYSVFAQDFYNEFWNRENLTDVAGELMPRYIEFVGRPIDMQMDYPDLDDLFVYYRGIKNPDATYDAGSSFVGYLVEQYGEQEAIAYIISDNEYNAEWDKSYDELVQDWNQYIEEKCSQYGINRQQ